VNPETRQNISRSLREKAAAIRLLVLDVDGVLTDGRLHFDADGKEHKIFHSHDGYGLHRLMDAGIEVAVISGRRSLAVKARLAELEILHVYLGKPNKLAALNEIMSRLELSAESVAYVGDDVPDRQCMEHVGLAVAVADAHRAITAIADWSTSLGGGRGAVRQVCDLILAEKGMDPER
jgi:3-deoxy-D-manno-octulosonate 8-phosphate phosphatase (KDO 8-P phosphatase)